VEDVLVLYGDHTISEDAHALMRPQLDEGDGVEEAEGAPSRESQKDLGNVTQIVDIVLLGGCWQQFLKCLYLLVHEDGGVHNLLVHAKDGFGECWLLRVHEPMQH
jgi:hypothetical protein